MKTKILLLLVLSSLILGCRSKHKMTTFSKENRKETEKIKIDSLSTYNSKSVYNGYADFLLQEKKNEISGDLLIKGKSDVSNPFVFHNVVGSDTIQSISIMGNAEYLINNHYTKTDHKKSEVKEEESIHNIQDLVQDTVSKEIVTEIASKVSEEKREIKTSGFQAGALIVIASVGIILILIFFTYTYFKK